MYTDKIIYGKNPTEQIIGIEIVDDKTEIFFQDGSSNIVDNEYWLLSNVSHGTGWKRLEGNLHYKFAKKYNKAAQYYFSKKTAKTQNADIYSISDDKEAFMVKNGYTYFKGLKPRDLSVLSFDIESTGLAKDDTSKILAISNTFRNNGKIIKKLFGYDEYATQGAMLEAWCAWVNEMDPSIVVGHNIYSFDLPYMHYIAEKEGVALNLGRNGSPVKFFAYESQKRVDGSRSQSYNKVRIYGREVIDTMFLALNYDVATKKYESYALKKIIENEITFHHEKKEKDLKKWSPADEEMLSRLTHDNKRTFYDASKIRENYTIPEEWVKIKDYCKDDSDDGLTLFDLMSPSFFYLTQSIPKSFQAIVESASGAQINSMMVRAYLQEGHSIPKASMVFNYEGAISYGNPGVFRNCFKVDVASLYPSIMIHHNIYDKTKDPKAYMARIVKTFTTERLKNKKLAKDTGIQHYDDMQNAQKIVINSMYGFMGAAGLNFNSPHNAALVTKHGREILQTSIRWATGFELKHVMVPKKTVKSKEKWIWYPDAPSCEGNGFSLVNCDTDSITITLDNQPLGDEDRKFFLSELNAIFPDKIRFEDDGYYQTIIVLAAKNYVLYDGKKIKTKGSSLKDAKKEPALKQFMFDVIDSMIKGEDRAAEIYAKYVKEAANITDIKRWASKKTISAKVLTSERTNESKIRDAIEDTEFSEGDKIYVFFDSDDSLTTVDNFKGTYSVERMIKKVFDTSDVFSEVLPKGTFINYKLKKHKKELEELLTK